jgi:transposase
MKKSDQIIYLHLMGLRPSQISRRLATSEQWISQLLSRPPAKRPRPPVVAALPDQRGRQTPESERKKALSEAQLRQCRAALRKRDTWTWLEADMELKDKNLEPPAGDITKLLREAGFTYDRSKKSWFRNKKTKKR